MIKDKELSQWLCQCLWFVTLWCPGSSSVSLKYDTPLHTERVSDVSHEVCYCVESVVHQIPMEPGSLVQWNCDCVLWGLKNTMSCYQQQYLYLTCFLCLGKICVYFKWYHWLYLSHIFKWNLSLRSVILYLIN